MWNVRIGDEGAGAVDIRHGLNQAWIVNQVARRAFAMLAGAIIPDPLAAGISGNRERPGRVRPAVPAARAVGDAVANHALRKPGDALVLIEFLAIDGQDIIHFFIFEADKI